MGGFKADAINPKKADFILKQVVRINFFQKGTYFINNIVRIILF